MRTTHVTGVLTDLGMETAIWAHAPRRARPRGRARAGRSRRAGASCSSRASSRASCSARGSGPSPSTSPGMVDGARRVAFLTWIVGVDLWSPIASAQSNKDFGGDLHDALPAGRLRLPHLLQGGRLGRRVRLPNLTRVDRPPRRGRAGRRARRGGVETLDGDALTELQGDRATPRLPGPRARPRGRHAEALHQAPRRGRPRDGGRPRTCTRTSSWPRRTRSRSSTRKDRARVTSGVGLGVGPVTRPR